jgi:phage antirepressor YoqD-like protein
MNSLIISEISIRRDADGRYCLNDLHRAAGGEKRHGPSYWLAIQQTKDLVAELASTEIPVVTLEGSSGGTFVAKELVYAYAMWISAAFHLKVIRAYDALVTPQPEFHIPQSLPEALRLAADLADQKKALEQKVQADAPKVEVYERISEAEGSFCIRDAAKNLQIQPIKLTQWLQANGWIYKRVGKKGWLGYQDKIQSGYLIHKSTPYVDQTNGEDRVSEQVRVTPKGLTKIAELLDNSEPRRPRPPATDQPSSGMH